MIDTIINDKERGQVGIGTLIVFIAMVLVAAIAAGVLINTAGVLQTQASDTGSETQEQVANQIEVLHASGNVDVDTGSIETVDMTLMKSAGSNEIDLRSMTVQYTSSHTDKTLVFGEEANATHFETAETSGNNGGDSLTTTDDRVEMTLHTTKLENEPIQGEGSISIATDSLGVETAEVTTDPTEGGDIVFTVTENAEADDLTALEELTITNKRTGDTVATETSLTNNHKITIDADEFAEGDMLNVAIDDGTETGNTADSDLSSSISYGSLPADAAGLGPGSSASVALVDQSGAQFTYGISVPSTFGDATVVEV